MTDQEKAERIEELKPLLEKAQQAQSDYWMTLGDLESELGVELDGDDLEGWDAESLLAWAEEERAAGEENMKG